MDPYIDSERLDPAHPLTALKRENLRRGDLSHRAREIVVDALPVKLTLQTTDQCNLTCPHCQIPRAEKTREMPLEVLERVVEELFPTLIELHPTNLGEPFLWRHFERLCGEMARHGVLLDLTTNGTLLDARRTAWILPIARDVKVSFDGSTPETFERLRRGARFEVVCESVRRLSSQTAPGTVALQMTILRSNAGELPGLIRLASELGVTRVRAYHLFSFRAELDGESMVGEPDRWRAILEESRGVAGRLGVSLQGAEPQGTTADVTSSVCHLPWHETWIDLDGAVLPCHSHGGDAAGNVLRGPFLSAWNGPLYRRVREGFSRARPTWNCEGCGMNCLKGSEHAPVPYDPENFLSPEGRRGLPPSPVRWSGRMRPFDLTGRRHGR